MKKWPYLAIFSLIIVCFALAFKTRASYRSGLQQRMINYNYQANDALEDVFGKSNISVAEFHSPSDLVQQADIIVACHFSGNRQATDEALYSSVFVTDVYKGSSELKDKGLTIVETVNVIENYNITPHFFPL